MSWQDKNTVKKGNIGESIINQWLISKGYVPYMPDNNCGAHPFDKLVASKDKRIIFIAEVKAKPARVYYPDTGINEEHYAEYKSIQEKYNLNVFLFFVDEDSKKVYGNSLSELEKPRKITHLFKEIEYPWRQYGIIYFPLEAMLQVGTITDEQAKELSRLSTRNAGYANLRPTG